MINFKLNILNKDEESPFLSTHFLGCPDVPTSWNDNSIFYNDEIFIGQINLKDITSEYLPKEGMLYFFIQSMSYPFRGIVRYSKDTNNCERIDFNDEIESNYNLFLDTCAVLDNIDTGISLFPNKVSFKNYNLKSNEVVLLKLDFNNYKEINLFKDQDETVCFIIKKDDLAKHQFDKAYLSLMLDN